MKLMSWWRRKKPATPAQVAPVRHLSYQCAVCQGIGSRENQEDAWGLVNAEDVTKIRERGVLALVADGMGGLSHGSLASQTGIRIISEDYVDMDLNEGLEQQLADSILHAAEQVYELLQGAGGSTMIACLLYDESLCYAGMGDSFLYLLRQGKLIRINREQNMLHQRYWELIRQGHVDTASVANISQPQAVTSFLGIDRIEDIDWLSRSMPLKDGDVLLLCSDGVGGVLSQQEICACLSVPDANEAALALQKEVLAKGLVHQDNFTAIVIRCEK